MTASVRILPHLAAIGASLGLLAACGGGGDSGATGTLRLALTDAPACGYDAVNVTIERVRVHKSASAGDNDGGWVDIALAQPTTVDLLSLRNGVLSELGSAQLEAGRYTQMRLVLLKDANTIVPTGGSEQPLTTPSATQSGLKFNIGIDVAANEVADFVLDFDACKSIVKAGKSGKYLLKPVLTVLPRLTGVQSVEGYVVPSLANSQTAVTLQQGGVVVRGTVPDVNGRFLLSPLPAAGSYDLVITADGRATAVMTGVPVTATSVTTVTTAAAPIDLPDSPSATASGSALTSATPATVPDATIRALQVFGTAPAQTTIEVAARRVDADDGGYAFVLPTAPLIASTYPSLTFTAQAATAGKYTLEASVPGKLTQLVDIDLLTGDKLVPFVFAP